MDVCSKIEGLRSAITLIKLMHSTISSADITCSVTIAVKEANRSFDVSKNVLLAW